ncbi:thiamine phosphate synthase [Rothia sp. CCM 9417]|uniref:thiamine phosphate synthase n=1 Tax=Rothia sp. CCM 9417 TaxID=3402657 RepID=UPI003AEDD095
MPQKNFVNVTEPSYTRAQGLELLAAAQLYLCTDARTEQGDLTEFLTKAFDGGVDIIQLRDKTLPVNEELEALALLKEIAHRAGKLFAVNDRADIAALVGADIFHMGQTDLTPNQARSLLGPDVLLGLSTHTPAQGLAALSHPEVDYFACGPVWETPTKPGRPAAGLDYISYIAAQQPRKPWFAIGSINQESLPQVVQAGASRIVVVRALTQSFDVSKAAHQLRQGLPPLLGA